MKRHALTKYCIRCEREIKLGEARYFHAILADGVTRVLEYFCEGCFSVWNPMAAKELR